MTDLFEPLTLPNGVKLSNRLCKAAMEENLSDVGQVPGKRLGTLYRQWANGGVGLILTGNVMISPDALTGPGGIVLDSALYEAQDLTPFRRWAKAAKSGGSAIWMQLNHPGRQVYASMGEQAFAPSPIGVKIDGFESLFPTPKVLTDDEIEIIIQRFVGSALLAEKAGFDGCQIHAAHGYLLSQFLSPLSNQRNDDWGGSLAKRARLLFDVVKRVREQVSAQFCVSVKLNSADFQKGGFQASDACWVVEQLNQMSVDLVELSGGSYESPAMQGRSAKDSTGEREAYFIDFARTIAPVANMPIMVTGGIRKHQVAVHALEKDAAGFGVDMLGIGRAMAFNPTLANQWRKGQSLDVALPKVLWKNKTLSALAVMAISKQQLHHLSNGHLTPLPVWRSSPILAILRDRIRTFFLTKRYRRWRANAS